MAYNNLDFDFKAKEPNNRTTGSFESITTGTFIPLMHGVTMDDINCSKELWEALTLNPSCMVDSTPPKVPSQNYVLACIGDVQELTATAEEWYIWKILVNKYFPSFKKALGLLPGELQIPQEQTTQFPAQAMNLKVSNNDDNIRIVQNLESQINTPDAWYDTYVRLCHRDLGTQEHHDATTES